MALHYLLMLHRDLKSGAFAERLFLLLHRELGGCFSEPPRPAAKKHSISFLSQCSGTQISHFCPFRRDRMGVSGKVVQSSWEPDFLEGCRW